MQVQTRAITFEDDTPSVAIQNPYLDAARAAGVNVLEPDLPWWKLQHPTGWAASYSKRFELIKQYCYAIPNMEALKAIRAVGPVIEVGAGSGYWAWCLRQIGADVIATDSGDWPWDTMHTEVERESATVSAERFSDRALMFCWPYMDKMAIEALTAYRGSASSTSGRGAAGAQLPTNSSRRSTKAGPRCETWRSRRGTGSMTG